jgi:hypothetical protein
MEGGLEEALHKHVVHGTAEVAAFDCSRTITAFYARR